MKRAVVFLIALTTAASASAEFPEPRNLPQVAGYCELDEAETVALLDRGLLVLDDQPLTNLYDGYYQLYLGGPPVYVTSDAMLYLWYEAHREALMAAEKQILAARLQEFVTRLLEQTQALRAEIDDGRLRENAVMLATVRALLDPGWEAPEGIAVDVAAEVARVRGHVLVQQYPGDDYTQYEVRGYYTSSEALSRYFRGAKYLARRIFRVEDPLYPQDATRELQRAAFLALAMRGDDSLRELYVDLHELRAFLAGPVDTIRLDELADACATAWGQGWAREDIGEVEALRAELADDRYPTTRINTRVSYDPEQMMTGKKIVGVLGEHYIPDSDLFMHTCEPRIMYRHLPSGLDVATALGSEEAARKLREVAAGFPEVVPAAREFGPQMIGDSVYGSWLETLRTLFDEPEGLPEFARTPAWDDKQINACLTSWAHLRHNYILYGAQAYTVLGMGSGSGIVEPLPRFFAEYARMCGALRDRLVAEGLESRVTSVLDSLSSKAEVFERCAEDQLAGRDTSWAQSHVHDFASFIKGVYFDSPLVSADVATSSHLKAVMHAASGPFHPIVAMVEDEEGWYAAVGYIGSYYEIVQPEFGRISDEEWKSQVEAEYARPEPPEWLAGLYPDAGEQSAVRQRLREIEELLRDDLDAGVAAAEEFMGQHRDTEWEPAAALIAAQALIEAERYQRTAELLARLDRMYGCDARDAARSALSRAVWHVKHQGREPAALQRLEEKLAATAPREGLSREEEIARQNERAEVLLGSSGERPGVLGIDADVWRRILEECARSQYVPLTKMGLIYDVWKEEALYGAGDPRELLERWAEETRPRFEALAEEYADSIFGLYARTAVASTLMYSGEYEQAWERVKTLLDAEPPRPEPYPQAAEWPEKLDWYYAGGTPSVDPEYLTGRLVNFVAASAFEEADVELLNDLVATVQADGLNEEHGDFRSLVQTVTYYADEPEAFTQFAPSLAPDFAVDRSDITSEDLLEAARHALHVAQDHPGTKTARAALVQALRLAGLVDQPAAGEEIASSARERLATEYPDSLENLLLRVRWLNEQRRWDEAQPLYERAQQVMRERFGAGEYYDLPLPLRDIGRVSEPAKRKSNFQRALAARLDRWGELVEAAGLPDDYLAENTQAQQTVAELLERLPERGLDVLEAADDLWRVWSVAGPVLDAHPEDPRALELRWQMGGRENLLAIVAGGPDAAHFEEAVRQFVNTYPHLDHDRSLRMELTACRQEANAYGGTPAQAVALECAGRAYLRTDRPERAAELLEDALEDMEQGRLLRDRLVAVLTAARRQVAAKRGEAPRRLWRIERQVSERGYSWEPSAVLLMHDGRVIIEGGTEQDTAALVYRDANSGDELWRAPTAPPCGVSATDDALIVDTEAGLVECLDAATGEMRWTHEMGVDQTGTVACAASGNIAVAAWDQGLLTALDVRTGEELWRHDLLPPQRRGVRPAIGGGLVYAWDRDGWLHALDLADGAERWAWDPRDVIEDDELRLRKMFPATPAVIDGKLLVQMSGRANLMAALDPATGDPAWHRDWRFADSSPAPMPRIELPGDRVILRSTRGLSCIALAEGHELWSVAVPRLSDVAIVDGLLLVSDRQGSVIVVDTQLGEVVATFAGVDAASGLLARRREGGVRVWALSREALTSWELALPTDVAAAP